MSDQNFLIYHDGELIPEATVRKIQIVHNPNFNYGEFATIKIQAGVN